MSAHGVCPHSEGRGPSGQSPRGGRDRGQGFGRWRSSHRSAFQTDGFGDQRETRAGRAGVRTPTARAAPQAASRGHARCQLPCRGSRRASRAGPSSCRCHPPGPLRGVFHPPLAASDVWPAGLGRQWPWSQCGLRPEPSPRERPRQGRPCVHQLSCLSTRSAHGRAGCCGGERGVSRRPRSRGHARARACETAAHERRRAGR